MHGSRDSAETQHQRKVRHPSASCSHQNPVALMTVSHIPKVTLEQSASTALLSVLFIYPTQFLTKASPTQA